MPKVFEDFPTILDGSVEGSPHVMVATAAGRNLGEIEIRVVQCGRESGEDPVEALDLGGEAFDRFVELLSLLAVGIERRDDAFTQFRPYLHHGQD